LEDSNWTYTMPNGESKELNWLELSRINVPSGNNDYYTLTTTIPTSVLLDLKESVANETFVLSLPSFDFYEALIEGSWFTSRKLLMGEQLAVSFPNFTGSRTDSTQAFLAVDEKTNTEIQKVKLTIKPKPSQKTILNSNVNQMPMFLSGYVRFQKFEDFVASKRVGSGKQLADIGRIILALFCVLLFIFIDSSPECLGLGLFMSLKALGVVASQRWYPDSVLPTWLVGALPTFLLGFADFMQLYFFTQLARLTKPKPLHWLSAGLVFGIIYSIGANIPTSPGGTNWSREVWRYRNLLIGIGCLLCALPVAFSCLKLKIYHRSAALFIASSGVVSQVFTPLVTDFPWITDSLWYKTWYNLLETHTPYVFALSTFVNVSTLEKRVKKLTEASLQSKLMEQEMALGRTVQEAFFRTPPMPAGIFLEISHNAEMYVSGDMIYSHHDPVNNTVTALLCDVTGHGVQAALKASVCTVICDSIWEVNKLRQDDQPFTRMEILQRRATSFLSKTSALPELLAIVGCEVLLNEKKAYIYRSNAVVPLMVFKDDNGKLQSAVLNDAMDEFLEVNLLTKSIIILFSDGLIDSSRTYKHFKQWLDAKLDSYNDISAAELKALILSYQDWKETHDDKTMCVLEIAA
ncbi:MAG: SpoIIE family protein phosphatase, partial [Proteobacteria bacterium]|nr:SpoIIE family protein phosphatase [Pseudomonadota bacterium]